MAPASLHFLDLPADIRYVVYDAYVDIDGGYVFNPRTNKLVAAAGNQKHAYGLQLTCKQIAREMSGLALRRNTLHFKVEYSDQQRIPAARFETTVATSLVRLVDFLAPHQDGRVDYTQGIVDEVVREFPPMRPLFDATLVNPNGFGDIEMSVLEDFGIPVSVFLRAGWRTFGLAVAQGSIPKTHSMLSYSDAERAYAASQEFWPWHYNPSKKDFARMFGKAKMVRGQGYLFWLSPHLDRNGSQQFTQGKYRFSAASKAIRFLSQCPKQVRMQLRRICLHETSHSVAFSECHALGLIPFCQENSRLYIERRVNIWRTLLQTGIDANVAWPAPEIEWEYVTDSEVNDAEESANGARLASYRISRIFARWAIEAVELVRSGMPRRSFKLVFDGDPAPQLATQVFRDIIQRDATWQRVIEASWSELQDEYPTKDLSAVKSHAEGYFFPGYSDMVDAIAGNKHELIECAFEIGPSSWDASALYRQFCFQRGLSKFEAVCDAYLAQPGQFFDMPHPLPPWTDLVAENILPEYFDLGDELVQLRGVDLLKILADVRPDATEDDIATSDDDDDVATEDARSYDGSD